MAKVLALSLIIFLAFASTAGYLILDQQITAAEGRIAAGQGQLAKGRRDLAAGKARLEAGRKDVSRRRSFFEFADERLDGGRDLKRAGDLIGERGDRQIAEGEKQVAAGAKRLSAGEQGIRRGRKQLEFAKQQRLAFAAGAAFFAGLAIVLGFGWRRSPAQTSIIEPQQSIIGQREKAGMKVSRILAWFLVLLAPGLVLSGYLYASRTTRQFSEVSDLAAIAVSVALGLLGILILVRRWGSRVLAAIVYVVFVGAGMYVSMVGIVCVAFYDCSSYSQGVEWARVIWKEVVQAWAAVAHHV